MPTFFTFRLHTNNIFCFLRQLVYGAKLIRNGGHVGVLCGTANVRDRQTDVFAQIALGNDGIATRFNDGGHGDVVNDPVSKRVALVFKQPYVESGMDVCHDTRKTRVSDAERIENGCGVGVEKLEIATSCDLRAAAHDLHVTAGILDEGEAAAFCHKFKFFIRDQALVGNGDFVNAE